MDSTNSNGYQFQSLFNANVLFGQNTVFQQVFDQSIQQKDENGLDLFGVNDSDITVDPGQLINDGTSSGFPLVLAKISDTQVVTSGGIQYDNQFTQVTVDMFSKYTTVGHSTVIPDNYSIVSVSGIPTWQYVSESGIVLDPSQNNKVLYNSSGDIAYLTSSGAIQYLTSSLGVPGYTTPSLAIQYLQTALPLQGQILIGTSGGSIVFDNQGSLSIPFASINDASSNLTYLQSNTSSPSGYIITTTGSGIVFVSGLPFSIINNPSPQLLSIQNSGLFDISGLYQSNPLNPGFLKASAGIGLIFVQQYILNSDIQPNTICGNALQLPTANTKDGLFYYQASTGTNKFLQNPTTSSGTILTFTSSSQMQFQPQSVLSIATTQLTGTITNAQIASITFSKISDSSSGLIYLQSNYGSSGQVLQSLGAGTAPAWTSLVIPVLNTLLTNLNTQTQVNSGQISSIIFSQISNPSTFISASQVLTSLGTSGQYLQTTGTTLQWASATGNTTFATSVTDASTPLTYLQNTTGSFPAGTTLLAHLNAATNYTALAITSLTINTSQLSGYINWATQLSGIPPYIGSLGALGNPGTNSLLQSDNSGNLSWVSSGGFSVPYANITSPPTYFWYGANLTTKQYIVNGDIQDNTISISKLAQGSQCAFYVNNGYNAQNITQYPTTNVTQDTLAYIKYTNSTSINLSGLKCLNSRDQLVMFSSAGTFQTTDTYFAGSAGNSIQTWSSGSLSLLNNNNVSQDGIPIMPKNSATISQLRGVSQIITSDNTGTVANFSFASGIGLTTNNVLGASAGSLVWRSGNVQFCYNLEQFTNVNNHYPTWRRVANDSSLLAWDNGQWNSDTSTTVKQCIITELGNNYQTDFIISPTNLTGPIFGTTMTIATSSVQNPFLGAATLTTRSFVSNTTWIYVTSCNSAGKTITQGTSGVGVSNSGLVEQLTAIPYYQYTFKTNPTTPTMGIIIEDLQKSTHFNACIEAQTAAYGYTGTGAATNSSDLFIDPWKFAMQHLCVSKEMALRLKTAEANVLQLQITNAALATQVSGLATQLNTLTASLHALHIL